MVFRSKVDRWVWLAFAVCILAILVAMVPVFAADDVAPLFLLGTLAVCLLFLGLFVWMLLGTSYRVSQDTLIIRSGPFRWRVERIDIQSLTRTRSPLSSPALSLDRIEIRYGARGRVLVSPEDTDGFAEALGLALE